jgi:hypothetical protein
VTRSLHETLYHLHEPETEREANAWLMQFLLHYNRQPHRHEAHSRMEDWTANLPKAGIRQMCSWERFCTFAREPEHRKVGSDAQISVEGVLSEVDPNLAGETVVLWWGLFDHELYVEHQNHRYGPYLPAGGPIPLHRYRSFKKTQTQKRADRIESLAKQLVLPATAYPQPITETRQTEAVLLPGQPFIDPLEALTFPNTIAAKLAIADYLGYPLAKLTPEQREQVEQILTNTLNKQQVLAQVQTYFHPSSRSPYAE